MKRIDPIVLKETKYIAAFTFVLSILLQSVFLIIGKWDYTVLLGNLLGVAAAVGNFLLMGLTVQVSLLKEEKEAKNIIKLSQSGRLFMLFIIALIAYLLNIFNTIAVIIPYLFPRIAVMLRHLIIKDQG